MTEYFIKLIFISLTPLLQGENTSQVTVIKRFLKTKITFSFSQTTN
jgi:hypothetical protein